MFQSYQINHVLKHLTYVLVSYVLLTACASTHRFPYANHPPLATMGYVNIKQFPHTSTAVTHIRLQALKETATTLGARGALAWQAEHINHALKKQANYLDYIFDFNRLLLTHHVMPPIIIEAQGGLKLTNPDTIQTISHTYKLIKPAHFVTVPPTWHNYLWLNFQKPKLPHRTLLPTNQTEGKIWNFYLMRGWQAGIQQANMVFSTNLHRLKRDYLGIILYRTLLAQGMINSPRIAKAQLGVTGNAKELRIQEEIMRITSHSALNPDSLRWNPIIIHEK